MQNTLADSYRHCTHVARTEARNFYYSFMVLPPEKRAAMCAVYSFMRHSDDVSDEAGEEKTKAERMAGWRASLHKALGGDYGDSRLLPAFHDTVLRHNIPHRLFDDLIDGVEMDLTKTRYETFDELFTYCYRVASVVGLVCLHVWGFEGGEAAIESATACGLAFQLTNILRDLKEDAERDRIYLPLEDLRRFGVSEADLMQGDMDSNYLALMEFEAGRARDYYAKALPLVSMIDMVSRPTFVIMFRIYRGLLRRIEEERFDVFSMRARLSTGEKLGIVAQAWLGSRVPGARKLLEVRA